MLPRYLICKWKRHDTEAVRIYLEKLNNHFNSPSDSYNLDIVGLVPEEILLNDKEFFNFIYKSNNAIAVKQTEAMLQMVHLENLKADPADPSLIEACLQKWNVLPKDDAVFDCTYGQWAKIVHTPESLLTPELPLSDSFNLPGEKLASEWHCVRIENVHNEKRTFYSSTDSTNVMWLDPITSEWIPVKSNVGLDFPKNTFVYGELVTHHIHHSDTQPSEGFHIIDAMVLNGQDIRHHPYSMRLELCKKFANAINNPSRFVKTENGKSVKAAAVNCKQTFLLKDLIPELESFRRSWKTTQCDAKILGQNVETFIGPKRFYAVKGLLFLRNFPKISEETNFNETFQCRQVWSWGRPDTLNVVDITKTPTDGNVYLSHFCEYMNRGVADGYVPSWRGGNKSQMPSRYSNNRGGTGGRGRGKSGNRGGFRGRGGARGRDNY